MARLSYFAEETRRNNNPRFYVNMKQEDLMRQVKRIIRDIKNGIIEENDLKYFTASSIINACINESKNQWDTAKAVLDAFNYYVNGPLMYGPIHPGINIYDQRRIISEEIDKNTKREIVWRNAYILFTSINEYNMYGYDIHMLLNNFAGLDSKLFYDL